jgi:hypothetical protein
MPNVKSKKTYTRRNTRTRLIDLLKQAIDLVEKGCPTGIMTRGPVTALPPTPLNTIEEEEPLLTQAKTLLANSQVELNKGRALEAEAQEFLKSQGIPKRKGAPRPGVLKYNEFVKRWISEHPEYQDRGKYQAALKEIQRTGAWAGVAKANTTRKVKSPAVTPGRLSPLIRNVDNVLSTASTTATPATPVNVTNANAPVTAPVTAPATARAQTPVPATPANTSYQNEGMDDTVGMRKIKMNGRNLYISSNNGLFDRQGNSPGDFVGRLVNGKIVEEEAPELPDYS